MRFFTQGGFAASASFNSHLICKSTAARFVFPNIFTCLISSTFEPGTGHAASYFWLRYFSTAAI